MKPQLCAAALALCLAGVAQAEESALNTFELLSPATAVEITQAAMAACDKAGYQVAVAVVDRMGVTQALIRDRFAGR